MYSLEAWPSEKELRVDGTRDRHGVGSKPTLVKYKN